MKFQLLALALTFVAAASLQNQESNEPPRLPELPGAARSQAAKPTQGEVPVLPKLPGQDEKPKTNAKSIPVPIPRPPQQGQQGQQGYATYNPLRGVWTVTGLSNPTAPVARSSGWVIFTNAYMSMHLSMPSAAALGVARFQHSMRRYRVTGGDLVTTGLAGVRNDLRGQLYFEAGGLMEKRRFVFVGNQFLRIYQSTQSYLELKKIESF